MKRFTLISLLLAAFLAGCETETRVIRDDTVAHKFSAFDRNGWEVTNGGPDNQRTAGQMPSKVRYDDNGPALFGPGDFQWSTNFKTDQPAPPAHSTPAPSGSTGVDPMTGLPLAH